MKRFIGGTLLGAATRRWIAYETHGTAHNTVGVMAPVRMAPLCRGRSGQRMNSGSPFAQGKSFRLSPGESQPGTFFLLLPICLKIAYDVASSGNHGGRGGAAKGGQARHSIFT